MERARQARRANRAGNSCRWCGTSIAHLIASARFCTISCKKRWHYENGDRAARGHARRSAAPRPQPVVRTPIPDTPSGHPVYVEALGALKGWERAELGGDLDSGARDLLQEYALAWLEGGDPVAAVARVRSVAYHDRVATVHGLDMVDGLSR